VQDLPLSWQMAMRYCPWCSGTGKWVQNAERESDCLHCGGTGDMFGFLLREAFKLGQEDALFCLRSLREHAEQALGSVKTSGDDIKAIKERLGV